MIDSKVLNAFQMMWGNFPGPVRLIHKSRKVLAVNDIAKTMGMEVGVHCFSIGNPESHKACKANEALSSAGGQRMNVEPGKIKFWIPVKDCPDAYVHFTIPVDPVE
jgi:hypothetical protein